MSRTSAPERACIRAMFAAVVGGDGKIYSVDISENFVKHIERTCRELGFENVTGRRVCSGRRQAATEFNSTLPSISAAYHHFEYPHRTMTSIRRALRQGGRVVVIDFMREEGISSEWVLGHVRAGRATVTAEIEASGFKLVVQTLRPFFATSLFPRVRKRAGK